MNSNQMPVTGGLAVFLAVVIGYFVIDPAALEGIRPGSDSIDIPQVHGIEDVQARLWQDPFAAAAAHGKTHRKESGQIQLVGSAKLLPGAGGSIESAEIVLNQAKAGTATGSGTPPRHTLMGLLGEISRAGKNTIVLAVMVSAGPYAKQAETRKRMRYAVLSGLPWSGHLPKHAEHIGYVEGLKLSEPIQARARVAKLDLAYSEDGDEELPKLMPYEWYAGDGDDGDVLLLWLDEDAFGKKPLSKLELLFGSMAGDVDSFKLIGPYGSTVLKAMVGEAFRKQGGKAFPVLKNKVDVYSATATAADDQLVEPGWVEKKEGAAGSILNGTGGFRSFRRTISTDDELVRLLAGELKQRILGNGDKRIAIISEWDTVYGRSLPSTLEGGDEFEVEYFTYMRGLDGELAGDAGVEGADDGGGSGSGSASSKVAFVELPEGREQKDYLRRLAGQIVDISRPNVEGTPPVRAIGVLGSDIYDKLLILRALKERFPKAVFFTTDMDAAFLHPDQFRWTRNVVVASAYGLTLQDAEEQGPIPAFRDSYQTSVYRSVRIAFDAQLSNSVPVIYEIGRNKAFDLHASEDVDPVSISRYLMASLLFVWLAIIFWNRWIKQAKEGPPNSRIIRWAGKIVWLCVSGSIIGISMINLSDDSDDYYVAAGLAMFWIIALYLFVYLRIWWLKKSWRAFAPGSVRWSFRVARRKGVLKGGAHLFRDMLWGMARFVFKPLSYATSMHLAVVLTLFFFTAMAADEYEPFSVMGGVSIWPTEFLRLAAAWLALSLLCFGWGRMKSRGHEIEKELGLAERFLPDGGTSGDDIRIIWNDYQNEGEMVPRIKRIRLPGFIWLLICGVVFLLQSPNIPFRGEDALWLDLSIFFIAIGAFFILFGFVVDAVLHCRELIRKLIAQDTWWPFMATRKMAISDSAFESICKVKREWYETYLIAMRTGDISKTVYYPIYVILLLLVAQSDYFDNWDMPYPLVLIATLNVGIILWAAIWLRRSAMEARRVSLNKVRYVESDVLAMTDKDEREYVLDKVRFFKEQIENVREGAFLPITEQPWLRALTLMTGGGSSILLLQYLAG